MTTFAAVDAQGKVRFVGDVPRGAGCGCFCPICQSPLVSKQGTVNSWHFAHEASQERPECVVGSINLLRRLAIECLASMQDGLPLPPGATTLDAHASWKRFSESVEFRWPVTHVLPADWNPQAPQGHEIATFFLDDGIKNHRIGLFVQIEQTATALQADACDGAVVFRCPPPAEGQLRTQQDAMQYLAASGDLVWYALPDFAGALSRVRATVDAQKQEFLAEQDAQVRARSSSLMDARKRMLAMSRLSAPEPVKPAPDIEPQSLPAWASWKKHNTSFFGFGVGTGECWVVMASADFDGCYIIPIPMAFEGWDESLPASIGTPMPERECFTSAVSVNELIAWFMPRAKLGIRIDGDANVVEQFAMTVCGTPES
ncbi:Competence-induced protein CoiA-like [Comamonadaceae bacterium]